MEGGMLAQDLLVEEVEAEVERHVRHYHENTVRRIGDLHGNGRWSGGLSLREP